MEVNSSASKNSENSEDSEENKCNVIGSNEDDSSFHLEENESDAAIGAEEDKLVAPEWLVYSDDEAYLFEVESEDETLTSFPKDIVRKNVIPGGPTKPDVRGMTKAEAEIVLKAYAKERKAYTNKQHFTRVRRCNASTHPMATSSGFDWSPGRALSGNVPHVVLPHPHGNRNCQRFACILCCRLFVVAHNDS